MFKCSYMCRSLEMLLSIFHRLYVTGQCHLLQAVVLFPALTVIPSGLSQLGKQHLVVAC